MNIFGIHHGNKIQQSNTDLKLPKIDSINTKGMRLQLKSTTKLPNLKTDTQNTSHFNKRNK